MSFDGSLALTGEKLQYTNETSFSGSNKVTKQEGLLTGLRVAATLKIAHIWVKGYAQLNKDYQALDPTIVAYLQEVQKFANLE